MAYQEMLEQMGVNVLGIIQYYEYSTLYNIIFNVGGWVLMATAIVTGLLLLFKDDCKKQNILLMICVVSFLFFMLILWAEWFDLPNINKDTIWTEPSYKSYIIEAVDDTETLKELYKSFESQNVNATLQSKYNGLSIMKIKPKY